MCNLLPAGVLVQTPHSMVHVFVKMCFYYMWFSVSSALSILNDHLDCNQEGIRCSSKIVNCSDEQERVPRSLAPTGPEWALEYVGVAEDENGLLPVINVSWSLEADGGISYIQGLKAHLLEENTAQTLCVWYNFTIPSQLNPRLGKWTFSLDGVVVDPGHTYSISVFNLPEPDLEHYRLTKQITVPRCDDWRIQQAQLCLENGSTWDPQMTVSVSWKAGSLAATVCFNTSQFSDGYTVAVQSAVYQDSKNVSKGKSTWLNVTFEMDIRNHIQISPKCELLFVVRPFFPGCKNKCLSAQKKWENCPYDSKQPWALLIFATLALSMAGCISYSHWKSSHKASSTPSPPEPTPDAAEVAKRKTVLLIYSPDHPLYTVVVLKLCSFLMAQCGTDVVLDLLDLTRLGQLGGLRWLDWHRERIERSPSDKILILCSPGVQAKWRAMCGAEPVVLREDLRSPVGDMLSPALGLIVPGLVRSGSLRRYIVAYFADVCSEEDIPAPFNVAVRYKLMEQFEEVLLRILEVEKQQPGRVNLVQGVGQHEYSLCPSGEALRGAVEAFRAHQQKNPRWFQDELVQDEADGDVGSDAGRTLETRTLDIHA
ncbi:interleukin-17 receptor A isoform X1 [Gadus morhua]|uniref:Interleukin-17 receptor A-like n=1 Tax=Gadus morhua TaxID=8049 RepID=A0A8C4YVT1_GADMO|nr:interleukin-17 receptor A-like isoform X1 [Gadus morhua]